MQNEDEDPPYDPEVELVQSAITTAMNELSSKIAHAVVVNRNGDSLVTILRKWKPDMSSDELGLLLSKKILEFGLIGDGRFKIDYEKLYRTHL